MITKSQIHITFDNIELLADSISKLLIGFDIDFAIEKFDYFNVREYENLKENLEFEVDDSYEQTYLNALKKYNFIYEINLVTSTSSQECYFLPVLTDFFSKSLSKNLSCEVISYFHSSKSSLYLPIAMYVKGNELIGFSNNMNEDEWESSIWKRNR